MKEYLIGEIELEDIIEKLNNNQVVKTKLFLRRLKEFQRDTLREELRRFIQNKGKSTIFKTELWNLLDKTKINLGEEKMSEDEEKKEDEEEKPEEEQKDEGKQEDSEDKEE